MRNIKNVELIKAAIHIMDTSMDEPLLNDIELDLNDEVIEFINAHIIKSTGDEEAVSAVFDEGENPIRDICRKIMDENDNFLDISREIARLYFTSLKAFDEEPSGDFIACLFNCEYGNILGFMKLDYNKTYIHSIDYVENRMAINIMPQMIGLPGRGQKLNRAFFISRQGEKLKILIIDGEIKKKKDNISDSAICKLLNCKIINDRRTVTKNIINTSEKWIRDNIKDDASKAEKARSTITRAVKADDVVNLETVAHYAFDNNNELEKDYIDTLINSGFENLEVAIDKEWAQKKLKRKRLKVDKDIEIYINSEAYEDNSRFEIKRNGDGTINILIKHVSNYIEKQ